MCRRVWKYAIKAVMQDMVKKPITLTSESLQKRHEDRCLYEQLYKRHLELSKTTGDQQEVLFM
jgi:hypothetical protein